MRIVMVTERETEASGKGGICSVCMGFRGESVQSVEKHSLLEYGLELMLATELNSVCP